MRAQRDRDYADLRLIVAHLGCGISISSHEGGRMIDVTNSREEGAFSPERAGGVPAMQLVELCFSGRSDRRAVETMLFREGGLLAYLGTRDVGRGAAARRRGRARCARPSSTPWSTRSRARSPRPPRRCAAAWTRSCSPAAWPTPTRSSPPSRERVDWIAPVDGAPRRGRAGRPGRGGAAGADGGRASPDLVSGLLKAAPRRSGGLDAARREGVEPVDEVVQERRTLAHLEPFHPLGERVQDRVAFQSGEALPDARMHAVTERHMASVVAQDVKPLGLVPRPLVAVR